MRLSVSVILNIFTSVLWKKTMLYYCLDFWSRGLLFWCLGFVGSLAIKFTSMNNQPCMVRPTIIDFNSDELHYCPLVNSISRCIGSCNTVEDLFRRICVPSETEGMKLKVFNIIKGIIESKTLNSNGDNCPCKYTKINETLGMWRRLWLESWYMCLQVWQKL